MAKASGARGLWPWLGLAAILFLVAWNMSEMKHFLHITRVAPKSDIIVLLVCFGLTVVFDMVVAVGVGVVLAALLFMNRMAEFAGRYWAFKSRTLDAPTNARLLALSRQAFSWIDHLPARLTATGFAIVGNFEEAVNGWRRDASLWLHANEGIILASAAGAVGLQLGGAAAPGITPDRSKTFDAGSEPGATGAAGSTAGALPQLGHLQSVVGLVWRSVVLWMLLAALLSLGSTTILIQALFVDPVVWFLMRLLTGYCFAGAFIVAESWLNGSASNENRGQLLSLYMVVQMGAMAAGQFLLNLTTREVNGLLKDFRSNPKKFLHIKLGLF